MVFGQLITHVEKDKVGLPRHKIIINSQWNYFKLQNLKILEGNKGDYWLP